jgi:HD superfamily phosphohydrolase YqeK
MKCQDLQNLRDWFQKYTEGFYPEDEEGRRNITLKVEHTRNVCRLIVRIGQAESLGEDRLLLAETVALFHDLGRFPQYAQYRTFKDSASVNHGKLGAEILAKEGVLRDLRRDEQEVILSAVRFHNAFALPDIKDPDTLLFLRLIRDADKLDIWRIFIEFHEGAEEQWKGSAGLGLPDLPGYSAEIIDAIGKRRIASLQSMKCRNDFILLQLSWIYDLNFKTSFPILREMNVIDRFVRFLPRTTEIEGLSRDLREYVGMRLKTDQASGL